MIENSVLFWKAKKAEFVFSGDELRDLRKRFKLRHLELALFFKRRKNGKDIKGDR